MKRLILVTFLSVIFNMTVYGQRKTMHKLTRDERAKLTADQQIAYENDRTKVHKKRKRDESTAKKVKRAKKSDRASRKIKQPKKRKSSR